MSWIRAVSALTAATMVVLIGVGTASVSAAMAEAGVMCKANEKLCSEANSYPVETEISAAPETGFAVVFEAESWRTKCTEDTLGGLSTSSAAGEITALSFPTCLPLKEPGFPECTSVEVLNLPYGVKFRTNEEGSEGTLGEGSERLVLTGGGKGDPSFRFNCELTGFPFSCTESEEEVELVLLGGEPAEVKVNALLLHLTAWTSQLLCAKYALQVKWYALYVVTTPSPLFFRP